MNASVDRLKPQSGTEFFKTTLIHPVGYYETLAQTSKIIQRRANIDGQINSLLHNVHENLKEQRYKHTNRRQDEETLKKQKLKEKVKPPTVKEQEVQTNLSTLDKPMTPASGRVSIPRAKVMCTQKETERLHRAIPPSNVPHFDRTVGVKEVLHQRALLEGMLMEHKQLQRDRETIVHEIQMMRNYLDDIRCRLDTSLKKLNQKVPSVDDQYCSDIQFFRTKFYNQLPPISPSPHTK
uniref:Uncharacterized protein n=1 Tax=Glossina pallidipes TaxID=7398 RepID=A0A1B0AEQ4_GLOPL